MILFEVLSKSFDLIDSVALLYPKYNTKLFKELIKKLTLTKLKHRCNVLSQI